MSDIGKIIGRQREIALLQEIYESPKAEFVAVYGRRRIGKTYLIDKFFGDKYDFYMTGIYEGTRKEQLANFAHQLEFYSHKEQKAPKDWMEALFMLRKYLETLKEKKSVLLFLMKCLGWTPAILAFSKLSNCSGTSGLRSRTI